MSPYKGDERYDEERLNHERYDGRTVFRPDLNTKQSTEDLDEAYMPPMESEAEHHVYLENELAEDDQFEPYSVSRTVHSASDREDQTFTSDREDQSYASERSQDQDADFYYPAEQEDREHTAKRHLYDIEKNYDDLDQDTVYPQNYFNRKPVDHSYPSEQNFEATYSNEADQPSRLSSETQNKDGMKRRSQSTENPLEKSMKGLSSGFKKFTHKLKSRLNHTEDEDIEMSISHSDHEQKESEDELWQDTQKAIFTSLSDSLKYFALLVRKQPCLAFMQEQKRLSQLSFVPLYLIFIIFTPLISVFEKMNVNRFYFAQNPSADEPLYSLSSVYLEGLLQAVLTLAGLYLIFLIFHLAIDLKKKPETTLYAKWLAFTVLPHVLLIPVYILCSFIAAFLMEALLSFVIFLQIILIFPYLEKTVHDHYEKLPAFWITAGLSLLILIFRSFVMRLGLN